jgi:hypothetical protein
MVKNTKQLEYATIFTLGFLAIQLCCFSFNSESLGHHFLKRKSLENSDPDFLNFGYKVY